MTFYLFFQKIAKMPRIDPLQLLKTLAVLLSPEGGIKSGDEVVRLVQLMQKFSKKLVSKSIYIEILSSTPPNLLERFLNEKGWDLLNLWFTDSIKTQNWPLCIDIMNLFTICPITAALLKDTADVNHAPKLVNQLRANQNISPDIKTLANQVYSKWVAIVSPKPAEPAAELMAPKASLRNVRKYVRGGAAAGRGRGGRAAQRICSNDIVDDSDSGDSTDDDDSEEQNVSNNVEKPVTVKIKFGPSSNGVAVHEDEKEDDAPNLNLLQSLAEEVSENLNKEKAQKEKEAIITKRRKSEDERKQKEKLAKEGKEKEKEKEAEKKRKQQQQVSVMDEKERKRFRPDRRDEVDPEEKQRIKEKARLLKEEAQAMKDKETLKKIGNNTSTFSRIPKIPKKAVTPTDDSKASGSPKDKGLSFEALLGGLDAKPKTVKTPMIKNKTAALLESFSKTKSSPSTDSKHKSSSSSHHHHHHHHNHHHSSSSSSSSSSKREDSKRDKEKESSSGKKESSSSKRHQDEKKKLSKLTMPKRNSFDMESPKSGKNTSFSESTGFMDALLNSMSGEDSKKRKRRLSEKDDEPAKKSPKETPEKKEVKTEAEDNEEEQKPVFSFYRDTLEETKDDEDVKEGDDDKESQEDIKEEREVSPVASEGKKSPENLPFEEPDTMPREVKGILVYHRGSVKRNKRIQFKKDSEIVSIRYFELDEEERVNVNKLKFENMRKFELNMEKAALKSKNSMDEETDIDKWTKPIAITVDNRAAFTYGHASKEKDIQFNREKTVLAAFLFSKETIPDTPTEPDATSVMFSPADKPTHIPLDDLSAEGDNNEQDYSSMGWPEPHTNQVDRQATMDSDFSLTPALSNILSSIMQPSPQSNLSKEELNILKAQTEAMAKLGILPGVDIPPTFPPPRGMPPPNSEGPPYGPPHHGPPHQHMPPPQMEPQPFEFGVPNEFYGGGPPPHQGPPGYGGPHFDRGRGGRFNNFQNNFHPRGPPGPGFPPHGNRGFRGGGPPMRGNDYYR